MLLSLFFLFIYVSLFYSNYLNSQVKTLDNSTTYCTDSVVSKWKQSAFVLTNLVGIVMHPEYMFS